MINEEVTRIRQRYKNDIQVYKEILSETLKYQLMNSLKQYETEITNSIKHIANRSERQLTILFTPEHIYKPTYFYEGDQAVFSLEHCIYDYIYEEKFFRKKQVKFTDINFKRFYNKLLAKGNIIELKLLNEFWRITHL